MSNNNGNKNNNNNNNGNNIVSKNGNNNTSKKSNNKKMELKSDLLQNGFTKEYLSKNAELSPDLSWTKIQGAEAYALVVYDEDSTPAGWVHWLIQYIPSNVTKLSQMPVQRTKMLTFKSNNKDTELIQGKNSWGTYGYGGPAPPDDKEHHYHFCVYALKNLDTNIKNLSNVSRNINKNTLTKMIESHVLAQAVLTVVYKK